MPNLEVEGVGTLGVEEGKRLILVIEEDAGVASSTASIPIIKQGRGDLVKSAFGLR